MRGVPGFGGSDEAAEQKTFPDKLTVYRRFRFRPSPVHDYIGLDNLWSAYMKSTQVSSDVIDTTSMLMALASVPNGYLYQGDAFGMTWKPCLTAISNGRVAYEAGESTAGCMRGLNSWNMEHVAPAWGCGCGFWAYNSIEDTDSTGMTNEWSALAAVRVWGNVVLGTKGVRAEKMEIVAVMAPDELRTAPLGIVQAWQKVLLELHVPQYATVAELLSFHPSKGVSEVLSVANDLKLRPRRSNPLHVAPAQSSSSTYYAYQYPYMPTIRPNPAPGMVTWYSLS